MSSSAEGVSLTFRHQDCAVLVAMHGG
jgi:hypothetical protein